MGICCMHENACFTSVFLNNHKENKINGKPYYYKTSPIF